MGKERLLRKCEDLSSKLTTCLEKQVWLLRITVGSRDRRIAGGSLAVSLAPGSVSDLVSREESEEQGHRTLKVLPRPMFMPRYLHACTHMCTHN